MLCQFESSSPHITEPAPTAGFSFLKTYGDKHGNMGKKYKKPTVHTTGKKWYVEYYYLIPGDLRASYNNKLWLRYKVYEEINRMKTKEYASLLRDAVERALENGYSPFEDQEQEIKQAAAGIPQKKEWTISQALLFFKQKWEERGLQEESLRKYRYAVDRFIQWLNLAGLQFTPAEEVTSEHIEAELNYYRKENNWGNRMYNNELTLLATAFNYLNTKRIIPYKLTEGIERKKTKSNKHRYYDEKLLPVVKQALLEYDEYLHFAAQCVYGLGVRSEKEIMHMKVGNIYPDRKQILLTADGSKTNARYIPITNDLLATFKERGILDMPGEWFVFGKLGKPGPDRCGKRWFATQFAEVRKRLGIDSTFTLYGLKHTKVIHMKKDGAKDDEIMSVTGHTDFASYAKYLRDLGIDVDVEAIQKKSRAW